MKTALPVIGAVVGGALLLLGLLMALFAIFAILDPVGAQMANDNDPFGTPPSLASSIGVLFACLAVSGVGVFLLIWCGRSIAIRALPIYFLAALAQSPVPEAKLHFATNVVIIVDGKQRGTSQAPCGHDG